MPVVTPSRASMDSVNAVPKCEVFSAVIGPKAQVVETLFGHGQADQAAAVLRHEVDGFGRDLFGGHGEVAFVFAVFVVDDDDHASGADLFQRSWNITKCSVGSHVHRMRL